MRATERHPLPLRLGGKLMNADGKTVAGATPVAGIESTMREQSWEYTPESKDREYPNDVNPERGMPGSTWANLGIPTRRPQQRAFLNA